MWGNGVGVFLNSKEVKAGDWIKVLVVLGVGVDLEFYSQAVNGKNYDILQGLHERRRDQVVCTGLVLILQQLEQHVQPERQDRANHLRSILRRTFNKSGLRPQIHNLHGQLRHPGHIQLPAHTINPQAEQLHRQSLHRGQVLLEQQLLPVHHDCVGQVLQAIRRGRTAEQSRAQ